jgi:hypothetical protein
MISAGKCRIYAAECELLASSSGVSSQRSLEQSIMAFNWTALADEIDRENAQVASAAFSPLGGPVVLSNLAWFKRVCRQAGEVTA